ncbi:hypothetical protein [Listeria grandensis]
MTIALQFGMFIVSLVLITALNKDKK